jgi:hypothetical protein
MSAIMERLPDTHDRNAALETAIRAAAEAVEAEERLAEAQASAVQMITDGITRLTTRMDAYVARREAQRKADEEEEARQEQERIKAMFDALPDPDEPHSFDPKERETSPADQDPEGIIPNPEDPTGTSIAGDDGELELKHAPDPDRYGDADPEVKAALSYGKVPLSYVKKHDEDPEGHDPIPFDPDAPGAVRDPEPGPEPGSRLYPPLPGVPQPVSISLNSEEEE